MTRSVSRLTALYNFETKSKQKKKRWGGDKKKYVKRRLKKKMKKNCASWEKRGKRLTEKIHLSIREQNPQKKIHIYIYIIYISK